MVELMIDMVEEPIDEDDFEFLLTNEYVEGKLYFTCPMYQDNSEEYYNNLQKFIGINAIIYGVCRTPKNSVIINRK